MRIIVDSKIHIYEYTQEVLKWCHENLILDNPEYYKRLRLGKWVGMIPKEIFLYERNADELILPFGCISSILNITGCDVKSALKLPEQFSYVSFVNPYPYQEKAITAALNASNGIVVMPCGSGKTQTALEIIARLGVKTLWLTHTQDLLNQSMNRAMSVFGCDKRNYGTITGGKVNIGAGITFATVQTMSNLDLNQYKDVWGCVVVDECHKAIGSPTKVMQFYKVLSNLACRYKFGFTATPKRADGLERSMYALLGEKIIEINKDEVAGTTCPVKVQQIKTGYMPNLDIVLAGDGTINYAALVDDLTHNKERLEFVTEVLSHNCQTASLVLANRVEYLKELQKRYPYKSVCLSALGNSKSAKAVRKDALKKLDSGELDCVFATYQLAKEGLDVPNLRYVVFATPEKDETTVMQAAGRVGRKADGKKYGTIIDFIDNFGMFNGWSKHRMAYYKRLGYELLT